jgi:RNA polymerase sigma-70 factor (ECF subfamily)
LEFFAFDEAYLRRLREGDPSTEAHFVAYFSQLIQIKLRSRLLAPDIVDDLKQETFARVLRKLRLSDGIHQADRLGSFVNSVCNNVLKEKYRAGARQVAWSRALGDPDRVMNLEQLLITQQTVGVVRRYWYSCRNATRYSERFSGWRPIRKKCQKFGVGRDYLRVLVHRAKGKFAPPWVRKLMNKMGYRFSAE